MRYKSATYNDTEWRCGSLALDMGAAFSTLFVGDIHESPYATMGSMIGKTIGAPIMIYYAIMAAPIRLGESPYPTSGERCIVPNFSFGTNGK